ncbi:hypothetical protein D3C71_1881750 [compost metagenome]
MPSYIKEMRTALHTEPSHTAETRIGHVEPNLMVITGHVFSMSLVNCRPRICKSVSMPLTAVQDIARTLFICNDGYIYERNFDLINPYFALIGYLV